MKRLLYDYYMGLKKENMKDRERMPSCIRLQIGEHLWKVQGGI